MRISFQRKKRKKGEEKLAEAVFTQAKISRKLRYSLETGLSEMVSHYATSSLPPASTSCPFSFLIISFISEAHQR